jgi:hypothetical protein
LKPGQKRACKGQKDIRDRYGLRAVEVNVYEAGARLPENYADVLSVAEVLGEIAF